MIEQKKKSNRGFAAMVRIDPSLQRKIARKGGKKAHATGRAHQWTAEEAREAGRKGGRTRQRNLAQQQAAAL